MIGVCILQTRCELMALITYAKLKLQQLQQGQSLRNTCFPAVMAKVLRGDSECRCVDSHFPASVTTEPWLRDPETLWLRVRESELGLRYSQRLQGVPAGLSPQETLGDPAE